MSDGKHRSFGSNWPCVPLARLSKVTNIWQLFCKISTIQLKLDCIVKTLWLKLWLLLLQYIKSSGRRGVWLEPGIRRHHSSHFGRPFVCRIFNQTCFHFFTTKLLFIFSKTSWKDTPWEKGLIMFSFARCYCPPGCTKTEYSASHRWSFKQINTSLLVSDSVFVKLNQND